MSKHVFDHRLAVIEATIDRYCMAIFSANSCHLASLEIGYLAIGEHEKCIYAVTGFERFKCCTTCVAGRRPNNGESLSALAQNVIHKSRKDLHGYVFEGQGRSVKQLEKPIVWSHLHQRSYGGMMESRVSLFNHPPQIDIINLSAHKGRHHRKSHLCVGLPLQHSYFVRTKSRPGLGHVQSTITCKSR